MKLYLVFLFMALSLLSGCERDNDNSLGSWMGVEDSEFAPVVPGVELRFPDDHKAHDDFRHEWWYLTANLSDEEGREFGIQWTQFRFGLSSNSESAKQNLQQVWQSQQIYMAHSAVTTKDVHYAAEKWSRGQQKLAGVETSPFRVFIDDWQWQSQSIDLFPATLMVNSEQFGYRLRLNSDAPFQRQGDNGYSQKSADGSVASYYYSQPFIEVSGELTVDKKVYKVKGEGWIDREWSSQFLLDSQQGWDWFALRLDPNKSLVLFQLRDSETGRASYNHARLMFRDGQHLDIDREELALVPLEESEVSGKKYPTKWHLQVPSQRIDITLLAINPNAKMPLTVPYWEGPISFSGSHTGNGYMELTGY